MHKLGWLVLAMLASPGLALAKPDSAAMLGAAPGLQVWLDLEAVGAGQTLLKPYLKSVQARQVHVSVDVAQKGAAGNSRVSQQASAQTLPGQTVLLARVSLSLMPQDACYVDIVVNDLLTSQELARHRLNCQL